MRPPLVHAPSPRPSIPAPSGGSSSRRPPRTHTQRRQSPRRNRGRTILKRPHALTWSHKDVQMIRPRGPATRWCVARSVARRRRLRLRRGVYARSGNELARRQLGNGLGDELGCAVGGLRRQVGGLELDVAAAGDGGVVARRQHVVVDDGQDLAEGVAAVQRAGEVLADEVVDGMGDGLVGDGGEPAFVEGGGDGAGAGGVGAWFGWEGGERLVEGCAVYGGTVGGGEEIGEGLAAAVCEVVGLGGMREVGSMAEAALSRRA